MIMTDSLAAPITRVLVLTTEMRTFLALSNLLRALGCQVTRAANLLPPIQIFAELPMKFYS